MNAQFNILFFMADQFAYDAIGAINHTAITPNLDKILNNGIYFENCYTNCPLCLPARASLACGLYPVELNTIDNYGEGLNKNSRTWMQSLRLAGYENSVFGKVHLHKFPADMRAIVEQTRGYGYDVVDELPGPRTYAWIRSSYYDYMERRNILDIYRQDMTRRYQHKVFDSSPTPLDTRDYADIYIADMAIRYLQSAARERPWFCTVSFGGPHDPWDAPVEYVKKYERITMPKPRLKPQSKNPDRPRGVYDEILNGEYDPALTETILEMTERDIEDLRRSYYGHVSLIDEQIGRVLQCVAERGELNRTIIVFTSDHGEQNGDYGLLFKQTFFESSVRVPLLIFPPDSVPTCRGSITEAVELMDLGPTICELAGIEEELGHARSLLPLIYGGDAPKQTLVSQIFGETMLLHRLVKAVFNHSGEIYLLFDLHNDPQERYNLAGSEEATEMEHMIRAEYKALRLGGN